MNQKSLTWKSWHPEEVCDKIEDICRSFGFFPKWKDFEGVRTFGSLCDVICWRIRSQHAEREAIQETFYRLRQEIGALRGAEPDSIAFDDRLDDLLPRRGRRRQVKLLEEKLGWRLRLLRPRRLLTRIFIWSTIISAVLLLFWWQIGLLGLLTGLLGLGFTGWYGKEFCYMNLGDLARALVRKNFISVRRDPETVNPDEIVPLIKEAFRRELFLAPAELRREAAIY